MRTFALFSALAVLACSPEKKADRPVIIADSLPHDTFPDDQCGDSSPGCPGVNDSLQGNDTVQMRVDSAGAQVPRGWPIFRTVGVIGGVIGRSFTVAVDSSTYSIGYRVSGFVAPDTIQVKLVRDSVAGKVKRVSITKNLFRTEGTQVFKVDKIYGTVASYSACTRLRRTAVKSETCQFWKTNFPAKPGVDTMWVDSSLALAKLDIKPDKVDSVKYGQQIQFCAFIVFLDGKVALRTQDKGTLECDEWYKKYSLAKRDITIAQQRRADSVCVKWKAEGGSITAENCDPSNPLVGHQL